MVPKPLWTHIGTHGENVSPGATKPLAIVLHIMQGTLSGCDSWFSNPTAQASANFGVGKTGEIHCYVDPASGDWPWANGIVNKPDAAVQALIDENPSDPNIWTLSIEHEGQSGTPLTEAQLQASAALTAWLIDQYGIPFDEDHLLGHYEFDAVSRAGCPGFDRAGWVAYEAAVRSILAPPAPPQPVVDIPGALSAIGVAEGALAVVKSRLGGDA